LVYDDVAPMGLPSMVFAFSLILFRPYGAWFMMMLPRWGLGYDVVATMGLGYDDVAPTGLGLR